MIATELVGETVSEVSNKLQTLLSVQDVTRRFGDFTAVNNVSFEVKEGEIFGLLGPNGAGKSTTIKMICTLLQPSAGHIHVAGYDVQANPSAVRSAIGIVFQDNSLDSGLTALENLQFHCMIYHIPRTERQQRIMSVLDLMGLTEFKDRIVKTYSGGMRRRLEIARGLLHEPRLLILDEPTVGLDPQTRSYIWQYVHELRERHHTAVLMTTHYMDEAENCDHIAIIDKGQIIALDTPAQLKKLVGDDRIEIATRNNEAAASLITQRYAIPTEIHEGKVTFQMPESERVIPQVFAALSQATPPIEVETLNIRKPGIEDVFLKLTGQRIRDEEDSKDERRLTLRRRGRL